MNIVNMRNWVRSAYSSKSWQQKVGNMPDKQVIALYYDLVRRQRIK